jgi:hypothetical protein
MVAKWAIKYDWHNITLLLDHTSLGFSFSHGVLGYSSGLLLLWLQTTQKRARGYPVEYPRFQYERNGLTQNMSGHCVL